MSKGYIAFDFDKTVAVRNSGDSIFKIGAPIPETIDLIKQLLAKKRKVKIYTARNASQWDMIKNWLKGQGVEGVEITNTKTSRMALLFDDRAVGLIENEGTTHMELLEKAGDLIADFLNEERKAEVTPDIERWFDKYNKARKQYNKNLE